MLDLLSASLGWVPDDQHTAFFRWKHNANPFGPSPAWVAEDDQGLTGFRIFLRWQWQRPDGTTARAVRAVDTATHPRARGQGVFSALTTHALGQLADDGVRFVFNTPNEQSRPGYLKMGWQVIERVTVRARPRSPLSVVRLARAKVAADKWSQPTDAGVAAPDALADAGLVGDLLSSQPAPTGVRTDRSAAFLAWRYGFEPLRYRAMYATDDRADGLAVFRLRRRGPAVEAAVTDVIVAGGDDRLARAALRRVAEESGADYVALVGACPTRARLIAVPGAGPTLVWRSVLDDTAPARWDLRLGDLELF